MDSKHPNIIDLFCGCGGFSLGFERAGFNVLLGIDVWNDALVTFAHNHNGSKTLNADLSTLVPKETELLIEGKKIDVIIGGPPCQGFSVAGKRIVEDIRNKLYKSFVAKSIKKSASTVKRITSTLVEKGIIIRRNGRRNGWWEIIKTMSES